MTGVQARGNCIFFYFQGILAIFSLSSFSLLFEVGFFSFFFSANGYPLSFLFYFLGGGW